MKNSEKEKYAKLENNMLWLIIGNFSTKILVFLLVPFYTYVLSTKEYGISDLITTTVSFLIPIFSVLISEGVLRFTLDDSIDKKQIITISCIITLVGYVILILLSPIFCLNAIIKKYIFIFYVYYFSIMLVDILQQFTRGLNHVKTYVISSVINTAANILLNLLFLLWLKLGILGYLMALIGGYMISSVFIIFKEKIWDYFIEYRNIDKKIVKQIISFCLPLIPNSVSWWISNSSDKYILTLFWGVSVTGIYSIAYKIPTLMSAVSNIFTSAWQISAVDDFGSAESESFFSDVYKKYSSLYVCFASILIVTIRVLAKFMFSKDFFCAWQYSCILIIAAMFQAICSFLGTIYTTAYKTKMIFVTTIIGAFVNIVMNFVLIPQFGAYGAAMATLVSYFVIWIIRLVNSKKIISLKVNYKKDIICYMLLIIQCIFACLQNYMLSIANIFIFILIVILNREIVKIVSDKIRLKKS